MGSGGAVAELEFVGLQLRGIVQHQGHAEAFGQLLQAGFVGLQADAGDAVQVGQRQALVGQGLA
ncbi:hypothetical protein D3C73_1383140 [compost metagenome]